MSGRCGQMEPVKYSLMVAMCKSGLLDMFELESQIYHAAADTSIHDYDC